MMKHHFHWRWAAEREMTYADVTLIARTRHITDDVSMLVKDWLRRREKHFRCDFDIFRWNAGQSSGWWLMKMIETLSRVAERSHVIIFHELITTRCISLSFRFHFDWRFSDVPYYLCFTQVSMHFLLTTLYDITAWCSYWWCQHYDDGYTRLRFQRCQEYDIYLHYATADTP